MMMVLVFTLDANDVVAEAGDAMDANMIVKGLPKGATETSGKQGLRVRVLVLRERVIANI